MKDLMQTLQDIQAGQSVVILEITDLDIATQVLRMGLSAGETVTCVARIPAGPVVIQHEGMELAIGRTLCEKIKVNFS